MKTNIDEQFAGMVPKDPWVKDFDAATICPLCNHGQTVGQTSQSNSHDVVIDVGGDLTCWFEQCEHVIAYRHEFHKGDVYIKWREVTARELAVHCVNRGRV